MKIILDQEDFEAREICREVPTEDGKGLRYEYVIELTPKELEQAFREQEKVYQLADLHHNLMEYYEGYETKVDAVIENEELCNELIEGYLDKSYSEDYLDWYTQFDNVLEKGANHA